MFDGRPSPVVQLTPEGARKFWKMIGDNRAKLMKEGNTSPEDARKMQEAMCSHTYDGSPSPIVQLTPYGAKRFWKTIEENKMEM